MGFTRTTYAALICSASIIITFAFFWCWIDDFVALTKDTFLWGRHLLLMLNMIFFFHQQTLRTFHAYIYNLVVDPHLYIIYIQSGTQHHAESRRERERERERKLGSTAGLVDWRGRPIDTKKHGGVRASMFIYCNRRSFSP